MSYLDVKVKVTIEPYTFTRRHKGRRGSPAVEAGTQVYVLHYETGGYCTYSYLRKEDAEVCVANSKKYGTDTVRYRDFNRVNSPEDTRHYGGKAL